MIGIVGFQDDVIGFALTGIASARELTKSADAQAILQAIREVRTHATTIIINETLLRHVRGSPELEGLFFIEIPEDMRRTNLDELERITRETLGVSL